MIGRIRYYPLPSACNIILSVGVTAKREQRKLPPNGVDWLRDHLTEWLNELDKEKSDGKNG
jgi:hypothetical protein